MYWVWMDGVRTKSSVDCVLGMRTPQMFSIQKQ